MGTLGYSFHENDNRIRTGNYEASTCLAAAAVLADVVEREGYTVIPERGWIDQGYLDLFRAEVSDATGINPWFGEWVYGYRYNESALAQCRAAVDGLLTRWGKDAAVVDLEEATVKEDGEFQPRFSFVPTPPDEVPVPLDLSAASRSVETRWENDGPVYRLEVLIGPSDDPVGEDREKRTVTLRLPLEDGVLRYSPALVEDRVVVIPLEEFRLLADRIYLPLANGLIGLGPDLWWLKSCRDVHLAARVSPGEPATVEFVDETVPAAGDVRWVFFVLRGAEQEALALARRWNTHPDVRFERSDLPPPGERGASAAGAFLDKARGPSLP